MSHFRLFRSIEFCEFLSPLKNYKSIISLSVIQYYAAVVIRVCVLGEVTEELVYNIVL